MKSVPFSLIGIAAVVLIGCSQQSELSEEELSAADKAAANSLATFRKMITLQNCRQMGFDSLDEARHATLDNSVREYAVDLQSLQEYWIGNDPGKMLVPTRSLVYPVLVNGEARSSITMSLRKDVWEANSFGYSNFTRVLAGRIDTQAKKENLPRKAFFIVRVPAFNLVFLGYRLKRTLMLSPVLDSPEYDFAAGLPVSAAVVFQKLQAAAGDYQDLPR
jgi:hypothetical protein